MRQPVGCSASVTIAAASIRTVTRKFPSVNLCQAIYFSSRSALTTGGRSMAATVTPKGGGEKAQRKLSLSKAGLGLQEPEAKARYAPPEHFKLLEGAEPLVQEALDSNTELWLVRIPANEISQEDLVEKNLRITVDSADGKVGNFRSSQGQEYSILKQDCGDVVQPYAIVQTESGHFRVRKIRRQVGFVRNLGVPGDPKASETSSQHEQDVDNPVRKTATPVNHEKPADKLPKKKRRHESSENS